MRDRLRVLLLLIAVLAFGVGAGGGLLGAGSAVAAAASCGKATAGVADAIAVRTAHQIYANELMSTEVSADIAHVTNDGQLAAALASANPAAVRSATHTIVYTPLWHIVRLRILSTAGKTLADVGGPYVLAPVTGDISYQGNVVGHYVISVQDDKGYMKLVSHLVGVPMEEYLHGKPLMGTLPGPPSSPPASGSLRLGGVQYAVASYSVKAFPTGTLQIAVFVPPPAASLAAETCAQVRLAATAAIVGRVATGLARDGYPLRYNQRLFVLQAYEYVHEPTFVLKGDQEISGIDQLDGITAPPAPVLPSSGRVTYDGASWLVASLAPYPPYRIYVLQPLSGSVNLGASGATGVS